MREVRNMTWGNYTFFIEEIVDEIRDAKKEYSNVYGIPRGGLITAVMLSHCLDIPVITDSSLITKKTLVCDDISDSGETLERLLSLRGSDNDVAVVVGNPTSKIKPTYQGMRNRNNYYINFPYEKGEDTISSVKNE